MTGRIDRRSFLALGVGAVAWACGRETPGAGPTPAATAGNYSLLSTAEKLAVADRRIALAVFEGQQPIAPDELEVVVIPPSGDALAPMAARKEAIGFGQGGETRTEVQYIYVVTHELTDPGVYDVEATFDGNEVKTILNVEADVPSPTVGEMALAIPSPTTADPMGVDPICTRTPQCSMHELTIAQAIESPKPAIVNFGTPRYCQSRTCGPVVDVIELAKGEVGDEVDFVHVEIWKNSEVVGKPEGLVEAFAEYKLDTEPVTYFLAPDGTVRARWYGTLGKDEMVAAAGRLVAGDL